MPKFEFDMTVSAPSENEAIQKMNYLNAIGSKLSLNELRILANTVSSPSALAEAKKNLGL